MIYHKAIIKKNRLQRGQSLVEFAISLVFLTMILWGVLDLARIYYFYITIEDAAAEAALYLALNPGCKVDDNTPACDGTNNAEWRAQHAAGNYLSFDWKTATDTTAGVDHNAVLT